MVIGQLSYDFFRLVHSIDFKQQQHSLTIWIWLLLCDHLKCQFDYWKFDQVKEKINCSFELKSPVYVCVTFFLSLVSLFLVQFALDRK